MYKRQVLGVFGGYWNEEFITQAENFPSGRKDIIDALSGAVSYYIENNLITLDEFLDPIPQGEQTQIERAKELREEYADNPAQGKINPSGGMHGNW